MTTVYTLVSWFTILGYWLLIAGVTLRILMKRRAVPSAMALAVDYLHSAVSRNYCPSCRWRAPFRANAALSAPERCGLPPQKWLNDLKACKHIFAEENSSVAAPLFKLCERRQGIAGVKRESATTDDRVR